MGVVQEVKMLKCQRCPHTFNDVVVLHSVGPALRSGQHTHFLCNTCCHEMNNTPDPSWTCEQCQQILAHRPAEQAPILGFAVAPTGLPSDHMLLQDPQKNIIVVCDENQFGLRKDGSHSKETVKVPIIRRPTIASNHVNQVIEPLSMDNTMDEGQPIDGQLVHIDQEPLAPPPPHPTQQRASSTTGTAPIHHVPAAVPTVALPSDAAETTAETAPLHDAPTTTRSELSAEVEQVERSLRSMRIHQELRIQGAEQESLFRIHMDDIRRSEAATMERRNLTESIQNHHNQAIADVLQQRAEARNELMNISQCRTATVATVLDPPSDYRTRMQNRNAMLGLLR